MRPAEPDDDFMDDVDDAGSFLRFVSFLRFLLLLVSMRMFMCDRCAFVLHFHKCCTATATGPSNTPLTIIVDEMHLSLLLL
jgi:hypothetical protein